MLKEKLQAVEIKKGKVNTDLYTLITKEQNLMNWMVKVQFIYNQKPVPEILKEILLEDEELEVKYKELQNEIEIGKTSLSAFFSSKENAVRKELNELLKSKFEEEILFEF